MQVSTCFGQAFDVLDVAAWSGDIQCRLGAPRAMPCVTPTVLL